MTLNCPLHGVTQAPGGDPIKRGDWTRQGRTWVHVCGREEGPTTPSDRGVRPVTDRP